VPAADEDGRRRAARPEERPGLLHVFAINDDRARQKEDAPMETKAAIRQFLSKHFKNYDLKDDEDIFSLGFVNSLFAMQLVLFVEQNFGITVEDEDLDIDNFRTINALSNLIQRKRA
jgi:acyl carrier protein